MTTVFVGLETGADVDDVLGTVPAALEAVRHFGGSMLDVDCTDKGAAFFLTFGAPVKTAEDPARAVACARELEQRFPGRLRLGLATGWCFSGVVGSEARATYTVFGDSVNLAARLMQRARPGEIVGDEATRARAGGSFRWGPVEELHLKGREATVLAAALDAVIPDAPDVTSVGERLIGRKRELAVLQRALASARLGEGRTVAITGNAGIGKTRLASALVEEARAHGVSVATDGFEPADQPEPLRGDAQPVATAPRSPGGRDGLPISSPV